MLSIRPIAHTNKDFLQLLKEKAEYITGILPDYKTQQAQDRVL